MLEKIVILGNICTQLDKHIIVFFFVQSPNIFGIFFEKTSFVKKLLLTSTKYGTNILVMSFQTTHLRYSLFYPFLPFLPSLSLYIYIYVCVCVRVCVCVCMCVWVLRKNSLPVSFIQILGGALNYPRDSILRETGRDILEIRVGKEEKNFKQRCNAQGSWVEEAFILLSKKKTKKTIYWSEKNRKNSVYITNTCQC